MVKLIPLQRERKRERERERHYRKGVGPPNVVNIYAGGMIVANLALDMMLA